MKRMLINVSRDELRVAVTFNDKLIDLDMERPGQKQTKSNIYKGKITSIEPSLGAVFVDYGAERHGFLPLKEISREYFVGDFNPEEENPDIRKLLKEGQELVVQIEKEERGTKGAALTTFISLAGAYLVLMPNNPRAGGISRRIDGEAREKLRDIINQLDLPEGMGVIIRTAGVSKSKEELEWDCNVLLKYWEAIKQAAIAEKGTYLIHRESDVVIRAIRDNLKQDVNEIIVNDQAAFDRIKEHLEQVRPDFVSRLQLYAGQLPIFSFYKVERQIEAAHQREVRLPSGGSIVIDHTEALVSIDINSARATRGKSIEETALNTNLEAAAEIARQLRIRDIGGLIVIDFIDMTPVKNQREVENHLRDMVARDRARIQIGRISRFGLLEMSRQRIRASLSNTSQVTCPRCEGKGSIRDIESLALTIIHGIQEEAVRSPEAHFHVQVPISVASVLINEKRATLTDIEASYSAKIIVIPNVQLQTPHYHIKTLKKGHTEKTTTPSYKLAHPIKVETPRQKKEKAHAAAEPAVNQFLNKTEAPAAPKRPGLLTRLLKALFAKKKKKTSEKRHQNPRHHHNRNGSHQHRDKTRRGSRGGQQRRNDDGRRQPSDNRRNQNRRRPNERHQEQQGQERQNERRQEQRKQNDQKQEQRNDRRQEQQGQERKNERRQEQRKPSEQKQEQRANERKHEPRDNQRSNDKRQDQRPRRSQQPKPIEHRGIPARSANSAELQMHQAQQEKAVAEKKAAPKKQPEAAPVVPEFKAPKQAAKPRKPTEAIHAPAQDTSGNL